jgi:hypothetical protein
MLSNNIIKHIFFIALPLIAVTSAAAKIDPAVLADKKGQVQAKVPDSEWYQCQPGLELKEKMSIKTGKGSRAIIKFGDDSTVTLMQNTEIYVKTDPNKKPAADDVNIVIDSGAAIIRINAQNELRISTPTAVVTADKGLFMLRLEGEKYTHLGVIEGKACASGRNKSVCPGELQNTTIKSKNEPTAAAAPDQDTVSMWKAEDLLPDKDSNGRPMLIVFQPEDGAFFGKPQINVVGRTSPGASLFINGEKFDVRQGGDFNAKVKLNEGESKLMIESRLGDQKKTLSLKVVLDTSPPMLTVTQPMSHFDPSMFGRCDERKCYIQVFGITEPGVALRINRLDVSRYVEDDGSFFINDFPLDRTDSMMTVEAEDQFRQRSRQILTIAQPSDMDGDGYPDSTDACPTDPTCH